MLLQEVFFINALFSALSMFSDKIFQKFWQISIKQWKLYGYVPDYNSYYKLEEQSSI